MRFHWNGRQLASGADPAPSELPKQSRVGAAANACELAGKRCGASELGSEFANGALVPRIRWHERRCACGGRRAAVRRGNHKLESALVQRVRRCGHRLTKHSRHHTPPSLSVLAALSSLWPHPCRPSSLRRPLASLPPQTRHAACQREPCGPGTTPRSMGDTALWQPGHAEELPKRG